MFFKEPLTELFFVELKMVSSMASLEELFEAPLFFRCNCRTDRGKSNGLPKYDPNLILSTIISSLYDVLYSEHTKYIF